MALKALNTMPLVIDGWWPILETVKSSPAPMEEHFLFSLRE
jgi:hypothetical protein